MWNQNRIKKSCSIFYVPWAVNCGWWTVKYISTWLTVCNAMHVNKQLQNCKNHVNRITTTENWATKDCEREIEKKYSKYFVPSNFIFAILNRLWNDVVRSSNVFYGVIVCCRFVCTVCFQSLSLACLSGAYIEWDGILEVDDPLQSVKIIFEIQ